MIKQVMTGIAALGLVATLAGCAGGGSLGALPATAAAGGRPAASAAGEKVVNLANITFTPDTIEIPVGTTVKWVNMDAVDHSVWEGVPNSGQYLFRSPELSTHDEFRYTFHEPGTYDIFCETGSHHLVGMKMQVVVK